jgi:hypothetical protein
VAAMSTDGIILKKKDNKKNTETDSVS